MSVRRCKTRRAYNPVDHRGMTLTVALSKTVGLSLGQISFIEVPEVKPKVIE